jgi:uncharacterized protein (TIGR00106 family)
LIIVEFSVVPLGTGGTSLSEYVSKACREVEMSGLHYMITPMGTIIETDMMDKAFEVIRKAHEAVIQAGAARVITTIKVDDRRDKERRMEDKVKAVKVKSRG